MLNEVFEQMAAWAAAGYDNFIVAVNISSLQIKNNRFIPLIQRLLEEYSVDPSRIEIEITKTVAMAQKDHISQALDQIRDMGIMIVIDDFGSEYSSLRRLRDLQIDKIKIAKHFIDGISTHNKDEAIIKSIIALANNLKIAITAEGVETTEQKDFLFNEKVDSVQGFCITNP